MKKVWLLVVFVLAGCGERGGREKVDEIPLGYRGRARVNPYLAAELYLREKGWTVESSLTWSGDEGETSLIFMPASFLKSRGMAIRILDWVADGGNLVLTIQGGEAERNDFVDSGSGEVPEDGDWNGLNELLEALEIELVERGAFEPAGGIEEDGHLSRPWEILQTREDFGGHDLEFEGEITLKITDGWDWIGPGSKPSRMVGTYYGMGSVLVMAHARMLRSPYLARADHAEFLEILAESYGEGRTVFLYGSSTSFFGLVWREGWMAVVGGFVVLGFWLWMRVPRFGPVLSDREVNKSSYAESLIASARFLWRTGQLGYLYAPLRGRIEGGDPVSGEDPLPESLPKDPGEILKTVQRIQQQLE